MTLFFVLLIVFKQSVFYEKAKCFEKDICESKIVLDVGNQVNFTLK